MGAAHFLVSPADLTEGFFFLRGPALHHARVLRLRVGEPVQAADGTGRLAKGRVAALGPDAIEATVDSLEVLERARPRLVVVPGIPKAGKLDEVIRRLAELGVAEVRPVVTERTEVRWDGGKAAAALARWQTISTEAGQQSRQVFPMQVAPVRPLVEAVCASDGVAELPCVVLWEEATERLRTLLPPAGRPPERLLLVVGPEGGLTAREVASLTERGAGVAGLGASILRAETAPVAAVAVCLYHFGLFG
ncbi:MAG: RsmE family RNA methyltransferase [Actinomycetota bacterium]